MAFSVSYVYDIIDKYSAKIRRITEKTKVFQDKIRNLSRNELKKFGNTLKGVSDKMLSFASIASSVAASMLLIFPSKEAIAFESQMASVKKAMNDIKTPEDLKEVSGIIDEMSKFLGIIPNEVSKLAEAAGKMGIPKNELREFLDLSGKAAISFDMAAEEAGAVIGKIKSQYKLTLEGATRMLDAVNYLADNTIANGKDVLEVLTRMQGKFNALKLDPALAAGWAAAANQLSVSPQIAASGLDMMLNSIQQKLPKLSKAIDIDPTKALLGYFEKLSKLPLEKQRKIIAEIFGTGSGADLALAFANNLDLLNTTLALVSGKEFSGSMLKEFLTKAETTEMMLKRLQVVFVILKREIGNALIPVIRELAMTFIPIIEFITSFVKSHPKFTKFTLIIVGIAAALIPIIGIVTLIAANIVLLGGTFMAWVGIAVGAIAAVVAAFMFIPELINYIGNLLFNFKWVWYDFQEAFFEMKDAVLPALKAFGLKIWEILTWPIRKTMELLSKLPKAIRDRTGISALQESFNGIFTDSTINSQPVTINGNIDIGVTGPGAVKSSGLKANTPGDLGFNMGGM